MLVSVRDLSAYEKKVNCIPRHTCLQHDIPCNLSASSSPSNPGRMYYRCPNMMNYNVNLRHCNVQQRNHSQVSQEHLMALWHTQQFLFLYVMNTFIFVPLMLKSV
ncbi:hypothetical protein AMTRI_Chr10g4340 [Amborella trichopoda]